MFTVGCDVPFQIIGTTFNCSVNPASVVINSPFDVSTLDPVAVVSAVGSGFIVAGIPFLVVMVSRLILKSIVK